MNNLSDREKATVLAALRNWQTALEHSTNPSSDYEQYWMIASDDGQFAPLEPSEIDVLCETINLSSSKGEL